MERTPRKKEDSMLTATFPYGLFQAINWATLATKFTLTFRINADLAGLFIAAIVHCEADKMENRG